jgi:hypothetical protein
MRTKPGPRLAAILLTIGTLAGCLEREETIRVARDGAVSFEVRFKGDPGDFQSGDALPDSRSGWKFRDETKTDDNGKEKQTRTATMRVAAGRPLPDSFADSDDPNYETALSFPTELTIERRRDGTYYHFKRIYRGREQARYEVFQKMLEKSGGEPDLSGKKPEELTDEDRAYLVDKFRKLEMFKTAVYVETAADDMAEEWPQHYGLLLRQAVLDTFGGADLEPVLALLSEPESEGRDDAINRFGAELIESTREALSHKMVELRIARRQIDAFWQAYELEQARRAVTEDLSDETWDIRVKMPGEIVAHNGERIEKGMVVWSFPANMLQDRDHVLMVTSRLGPGDRSRDGGE